MYRLSGVSQLNSFHSRRRRVRSRLRATSTLDPRTTAELANSPRSMSPDWMDSAPVRTRTRDAIGHDGAERGDSGHDGCDDHDKPI